MPLFPIKTPLCDTDVRTFTGNTQGCYNIICVWSHETMSSDFRPGLWFSPPFSYSIVPHTAHTVPIHSGILSPPLFTPEKTCCPFTSLLLLTVRCRHAPLGPDCYRLVFCCRPQISSVQTGELIFLHKGTLKEACLIENVSLVLVFQTHDLKTRASPDPFYWGMTPSINELCPSINVI